MAQSCFDAAAKTLSTLEKRGMKMCPILVKLAEINFLLYDFKASEVMVDALIQRSMPEPSSLLFGYLLKSYFCTLKSEEVLAQECLKRAQTLQSDAKVEDLSVIKNMQKQRLNYVDNNSALASSMQGEGEGGAEVGVSGRNRMRLQLRIKPGEEDSLSSFPDFFAHFLSNFGGSLESKLGEVSASKS